MLFIKKNLYKFILIILLVILFVYSMNISSIPNNVVLINNQELNIKTLFGINVEETIAVDSNLGKNISNKKEYNISFLGFNIKRVIANIVENTKVIPLGNIAGLKLYSKGILVVGLSEIEGADGKIYKPYEECNIQIGDSILAINNVEVNSTEKLIKEISKNNGEKLNIKYLSNGKEIEKSITPVKTNNNVYKIGIWVRDIEAGVGTLTFYNSATNKIAALGHGIHDVDTGEIVEISYGEFVTADIVNIKKGEENNPGKLEGNIDNCIEIGTIYKNSEFGVFGEINNIEKLNINLENQIEVASRNEIKQGKATILCSLENNEVKSYEVEIEKIYINNNVNNKSMVVKITDEELLQKTGGIIQGMSGSPIIQNGKFIGALTHVLVQNPTKGYGVFADIMMQKIEE